MTTTDTTDTADLIAEFRRHIAADGTGAVYAAATGAIRAYAQPRPTGAIASWSHAQRLAAIGQVLDALDAAQREESSR